MAEPIHSQAVEILNTWKTDAKINKNIHNAAASHYWRISKCINIPLLAIMAVSGTTILTTISSDPNDTKIAIISGVLVTLCAFIQTLLVFLGLDDKETTHRNTARLYQQVLDETETFNLIHPSYETITQFLHHIDVIRKLITAIKIEPPRSIYYKYANELLNDDIREEIRKLSSGSNYASSGITSVISTRNGSQQHNPILSIGDWSDHIGITDRYLQESRSLTADNTTTTESQIEDIHPNIASDIDRRTNYWPGAIANSVQEARANIYKVSGIHHL